MMRENHETPIGIMRGICGKSKKEEDSKYARNKN